MSFAPKLSSLPDDLLLRIISASGPPGVQVGTAYRLGAVNQKFRQLLETRFLPGITVLSYDCLSDLSLANIAEARDALTKMFARMSMVREVNLGGCPSALLSRKAVEVLVRAAGGTLQDVDLAYCRVRDEVVAPFLKCRSLRKLRLYGCNCLTGRMFVDHPVVAQLTSLDVNGVNGLTSKAIRAIGRIGSLRNVNMIGVETLNTRTMKAFSSGDVRFSLRSISLSCRPLTDAALYDLLSRATNLEKLILAESTSTLWGVGNFSKEGMEKLKTKFPHVQIVFVT